MIRKSFAYSRKNANKNNKFWLGVNQFADLSTEDFKANKGFKPISGEKVPITTGFKYENLSVSALPTTVDWRTKGAVTPIKNQGQCGNVHFWSYLKDLIVSEMIYIYGD